MLQGKKNRTVLKRGYDTGIWRIFWPLSILKAPKPPLDLTKMFPHRNAALSTSYRVSIAIIFDNAGIKDCGGKQRSALTRLHYPDKVPWRSEGG